MVSRFFTKSDMLAEPVWASVYHTKDLRRGTFFCSKAMSPLGQSG